MCVYFNATVIWGYFIKWGEPTILSVTAAITRTLFSSLEKINLPNDKPHSICQ